MSLLPKKAGHSFTLHIVEFSLHKFYFLAHEDDWHDRQNTTVWSRTWETEIQGMLLGGWWEADWCRVQLKHVHASRGRYILLNLNSTCIVCCGSISTLMGCMWYATDQIQSEFSGGPALVYRARPPLSLAGSWGRGIDLFHLCRLIVSTMKIELWCQPFKQLTDYWISIKHTV